LELLAVCAVILPDLRGTVMMPNHIRIHRPVFPGSTSRPRLPTLNLVNKQRPDWFGEITRAVIEGRWPERPEDTKCSPSGYVKSSELAAIEALVPRADLSGMKSPMTELPPTNTRRWVARRKAAVLAAVSSGVLTIEEAYRRYHMSEHELLAWQRAFERYGIDGLRSGHAQPIQKRRRPRNDAPR